MQIRGVEVVGVGVTYARRRDPRSGELYYVHRAVAAWVLGRDLRPGEVVHHIDGDKRNNHPSNLEVLPSQSRHMMRHHYERKLAAHPSLFD